MIGVEAARLGQAIERFKERSQGQELPDGLDETLSKAEGLLKQEPSRQASPGERAAGKTGTTSRAASGTAEPSPGQRAALGRK